MRRRSPQGARLPVCRLLCYDSRMASKLSRKTKRLLWGGCALLAALVLSWRPCNNALLFHVLPEDAYATSFHYNLASEWHALVRHPMLIGALEAAGVEEAADLVDETGFYQTLYWLTGPKSTLALNLDPVPASRSLPENASSFEVFLNDIGLAPESIRVSGASYVGWKRRPMELLWRIRYVPGLGPLNVTESGTRYLVFRHSKTMQRMGLVLSLDMVDGHLLAALSTDPDAVTSLVARAQSVPDTPVDLPQTPHTLTLNPRLLSLASDLVSLGLPDDSAPVHLDLGSFRDRSRLSLRLSGDASGGALAPANPIGNPEDSPLLASVAVSPSLLPTAEESDPPAAGPCSLILYGNPCPSTFCGFNVPALAAFLPPDSPALPPRVRKLIDASYGQDKKRPKLEDLGGGLHRLDLRPLFPKHSPIKPDKLEEPFFLVPADSRETPVAGSCLYSYQNLGKGGTDLVPILTASQNRWTSARSPESADPLAVGWIDLPRTAAELRNVESILRLASLFLGDSVESLREIQKSSEKVLGAAAALGVLDFTVRQPFLLEATFAREP